MNTSLCVWTWKKRKMANSKNVNLLREKKTTSSYDRGLPKILKEKKIFVANAWGHITLDKVRYQQYSV